MPDRHLVIVPLAHGATRGRNRTGSLSVLLLPRLRANGVLSNWSSDWARWPEAVLGARPNPSLALTVAIDGQVVSQNTAISVRSPRWSSAPPDPNVWKAVFGAGPDAIRVRHEHQIDRRLAPFAPMYDAVSLADDIGRLFDELGRSFRDRPPLPDELTKIGAYADAMVAGHAAAHADHLAPLESDGAAGEAMDVADPEFHDALSVLQAHPHLLRALGLVVDLQVALPDRCETVAVASNYPAQQSGTPGQVQEVRLVLTVDDDFWPRRARPNAPGPDAVGSWRLLDDDDHAIESVDPAAFVDWLESWRSADGEPGALPEAGVLVARSGPSVVHELEDRAERHHQLWQAIAGRWSTGSVVPIPIDADDIALGLRFDVRDHAAGRWFSLWEREAPDGFRFPRDPSVRAVPPIDESWITQTAFTEADLFIVENVDRTPRRVSPVSVAWRGWSLAAPPPGSAVSGETGAVERRPGEPPVDSGLQVAVDYRVPAGTLPRLRFGREYSIRARVVDYAGNSPALRDREPSSAAVLGPHRFGRTIPLQPPLPVRRMPRPIPGRGDTVDTIVIRSDLVDPSDPGLLVLQDDRTVQPTARLFFPPGTTVSRCEMHGLPGPDGLPTDETTFRMLVQRDAASLETQAALDPATGELVHPDGQDWRPAATYLVDPAAVGVAFEGLPGAHDTVVAPLSGTWPDRDAVAIEVRAGEGAPTTPTEADAPAVRCEVPKGRTRTVEVSCAAGLLDHWRVYQRAVGTSVAGDVIAAIETGRHWMVSARRPVTLVHATRLPLRAPVVTGLVVNRIGLDDTRGRATGRYGLDVASTSRLTMTGTWTDPDDPGSGGVGTRTTRRVLLTESWDYPEDHDEDTRDVSMGPFDLGDTKRHTVSVTVEAFSRYARHFAERTEHAFDAGDVVTVSRTGLAPGSVEVFHDGSRVRIGQDVIVDHAAGTLERHPRGALPIGARVQVDAVHAPFSRSSEHPVQVVVANASVPAAAGVHTVLPAFRRTVDVADAEVVVTHRADVVRVWLDRPWYSTGEGELLGVVVHTSDLESSTRLGRDPLVGGAGPGPLTVASFPSAIRSETFGDMSVAGHDVHFDAEHDRWYADVELDPALVGHRPFLRLAVARFQPVSVPGAHLGPVSLAEPVRLGGSRTVRAWDHADGVGVEVIGQGADDQVSARLQRFEPSLADPDLGWLDTGVEIELDRNGDRWAGVVDATAAAGLVGPFRLVVLDAEPRTRDGQPASHVAYVETVEVPAVWLEAEEEPPPVGPWEPSQVTGVAVTGRQRGLDVSWDPVEDPDGDLRQYEVQVRESTDDTDDADDAAVPSAWPVVVTTRPRSTSARVGGLTNGVLHDVRVRAVGPSVAGPWSATVQGTPGR